MENKKDEKLPSKDKDASLPSRIAQSASDLAKGFISNSAASSNATMATLAASAATEKSHAESSAAGASKAIENLPSRAIGSSEMAYSGFRELAAVTSPSPGNDTLSDELQHFTTTSVDFSQWDANPRVHSQDPWFEKFHEERSPNGDAAQISPGHNGNGTTTYGFDASAFADRNDGSEVVALLNNNYFNENWEQEGFERDGIPEPSANDLFSPALMPEDQDMANHLRAGLPLASSHNTFNLDSHMNLSPNLEILLPASTAEDLTPEQRETWLQQWYSVLTNYTDEVWGDSLPQVQEARQEIEQIQEQRDEHASKQAVRRLGMILGHVHIPRLQNTSAKARGKRPVRFAEPPVNGTKE